MEATVVDRGFHVDNREASKYTVLHSLLDARLNRIDVLFGNDAADDFIFKDEAAAGLVGLNFNPTMTVLPVTARLTDEFAFALLRLADGLAVSNLRLADFAVNVKLLQHAVDDNLQMQFAHAGNNDLPGFGVGADFESRIFLGKFLERDTHLVLVVFG